MAKIISGIQQIGIGIPDAQTAFEWYKKVFGTDIRIFDDEATAELMLPYTGGKPRDRRAILALNLQSGGGFEIWQYTSRTPQAAEFDIQLGDLGIYAAKIKAKDIASTHKTMKGMGVEILGDISLNPAGQKHFYIRDPYQNVFEVVEGYGWFKEENKNTGSVFGACIGVSDIDKSLTLYKDVLGYNEVICDKTQVFKDFEPFNTGKEKYRRVILKHTEERKGAFAPLLGPTEIELVQALDRTPRKIFENRFWGDLGFIHICFDVNGMRELEADCNAAGFPFTVDSAAGSESFDMGDAAGHFTYIEDPDGTLIEFVETHKLPLIKKIGWSLDLRKRNPEKPLPKWMLNAMRFSRVK